MVMIPMTPLVARSSMAAPSRVVVANSLGLIRVVSLVDNSPSTSKSVWAFLYILFSQPSKLTCSN